MKLSFQNYSAIHVLACDWEKRAFRDIYSRAFFFFFLITAEEELFSENSLAQSPYPSNGEDEVRLAYIFKVCDLVLLGSLSVCGWRYSLIDGQKKIA